jgi:uncharacterized membrane protein (Fun14 family)
MALLKCLTVRVQVVSLISLALMCLQKVGVTCIADSSYSGIAQLLVCTAKK